MLSNRERVKSYIGKDVILVMCPSLTTTSIEIAVGHLCDYYFLAENLPFGTAVTLGAKKFSIDVSFDEYRQGRTSWTFSFEKALEEWASNLPSRMELLGARLPAGSTMEDINGVMNIAPLSPGMLTKYFEKANELFENNEDTPPSDP